jgi:hypothetical protein
VDGTTRRLISDLWAALYVLWSGLMVLVIAVGFCIEILWGWEGMFSAGIWMLTWWVGATLVSLPRRLRRQPRRQALSRREQRIVRALRDSSYV